MSAPMHVLVVEDSEPVRGLVALALRSRGFVVHEADCGAAALRIAHDVAPSLAIVDQWMPGMTGAEVIRILRASRRSELRALPVIGLSGRTGSERELLGAGAQLFLAKPFGEAELLAAVRRALGAAAPSLAARR